MIKNLDEKYECRLQIKLSEINIKFNETISVLESRIESLENTTERNLEHTETLMIDLNNKNMITRNMLYDVKKEFARTTREYTTHYTNTSKDIKLLKDNYVTQNNDIKLLKDNFVTQEELNEAIDNVVNNLHPKGQTMIKCDKCTNDSLCFECNEEFKSYVNCGYVRLTKDYKGMPIFKYPCRVLTDKSGISNGKITLIRFNRTYYYKLKGTDFETQKDKEFLINFKSITGDEFFKQCFKGVERVFTTSQCGTSYYNAYNYSGYFNLSIG